MLHSQTSRRILHVEKQLLPAPEELKRKGYKIFTQLKRCLKNKVCLLIAMHKPVSFKYHIHHLRVGSSLSLVQSPSILIESVVKKIFYSGLAEKIITLPVNATSILSCKEMGLETNPLQLRLIRIQHGDKVQVLVTSLIDSNLYPINIFYDLYLKRWPVEEDYKFIKCRMELENFSGKSVLSVYQDFHAKIFAKNWVAILSSPVNNHLENNCDKLKYVYHINSLRHYQNAKVLLLCFFTKP